ncbi:hypothetical protein SAMN06265795_12125 [Noviherbaspirillum humi]|uniref:Uncharacterized protein n=1 Tax=Noviherbaspirillum humi TaxID=1688639 RepID=A0A239LCR1_9BURK|nr:hypothetical protein [Noviherbaspirillum humi]SNT27708.1 hypothetical protein SAMN06265795_12125 [Noviherbaspirillum humi]
MSKTSSKTDKVKAAKKKPVAELTAVALAAEMPEPVAAPVVVPAEPAEPDAPAAPAAEAQEQQADATQEHEQVAEKSKPPKVKLVRDSFTMPEDEYRVLGDVKKACLAAGYEVKKSELLRVGVALIRQMDIDKLKEIHATLPALKAGRPKKHK